MTNARVQSPFPGMMYVDKRVLLADLNSLQAGMECNLCGGLEVRIQWLDGCWELHWGDPSFDTDLRGLWGSSYLTTSGNALEDLGIAQDVAEELISTLESSV